MLVDEYIFGLLLMPDAGMMVRPISVQAHLRCLIVQLLIGALVIMKVFEALRLRARTERLCLLISGLLVSY